MKPITVCANLKCSYKIISGDLTLDRIGCVVSFFSFEMGRGVSINVVLTVLELTSSRLASNSQRLTYFCFCLPSAGFKGIKHRSQL